MNKIPEVGSVLWLRTERITAKKSYDQFRQDIIAYLGAKMKCGNDLLPLIRALKDPINNFINYEKPKKEDLVDDKDGVEKMLFKYKVKSFGVALDPLQENMKTVFQLIWGQYSDSLPPVIKNIEDFNDKQKENDSLWLLRTLKELVSRIDIKGNKYLICM